MWLFEFVAGGWTWGFVLMFHFENVKKLQCMSGKIKSKLNKVCNFMSVDMK